MAFRSRPSVYASRVLVTGGARGIGAATAALFAAHGARVWIGDVDEDVCLTTAAELGVAGLALDVTSAMSWRDCLDRIEASTDVTNIAEQKSLERAGFTREGVLRSAQKRADGRHDLYAYSILPADLLG